jgi:hypothetical protein
LMLSSILLRPRNDLDFSGYPARLLEVV